MEYYVAKRMAVGEIATEHKETFCSNGLWLEDELSEWEILDIDDEGVSLRQTDKLGIPIYRRPSINEFVEG